MHNVASDLAEMTQPSTVLIVDDHPLFSDALSLTLESVARIDEILTADTLDAAISSIEQGTKPDIILLDLNLPDVTGIDGLIRLKRIVGDIPVVVISSLSDQSIVASVLQAGASGFVPKHSTRDVFQEAFFKVGNGETYLPEGYIPTCNPAELKSDNEEAIRRLSELTPQQAKILQLVCAGKMNKQIAYDLSIAETTVKAHITAVLRKLGVQSRTQAVLLAERANFSNILRDKTDLA